ncbi:hypothetical protein JXB31_04555 [Candidatus Woesearchaeota archaeon]|nr:hypothetical protein [Candidatus Woesearchaeota archaeon]
MMKKKTIVLLAVIAAVTMAAALAADSVFLDWLFGIASDDSGIYESGGKVLIEQQDSGYIRDSPGLQKQGFDIEVARENSTERWVISEQD